MKVLLIFFAVVAIFAAGVYFAKVVRAWLKARRSKATTDAEQLKQSAKAWVKDKL